MLAPSLKGRVWVWLCCDATKQRSLLFLPFGEGSGEGFFWEKLTEFPAQLCRQRAREVVERTPPTRAQLARGEVEERHFHSHCAPGTREITPHPSFDSVFAVAFAVWTWDVIHVSTLATKFVRVTLALFRHLAFRITKRTISIKWSIGRVVVSRCAIMKRVDVMHRNRAKMLPTSFAR